MSTIDIFLFFGSVIYLAALFIIGGVLLGAALIGRRERKRRESRTSHIQESVK